VEIKRLALFRLVQESLTNIARHAEATRVTIRIERGGGSEHTRSAFGEVVVAIADNGKGMDLEAPRAGLGLVGMRERVAALGGRLKLTSRPGAGLEIVASIPLAPPLPPSGRHEQRAVRIESMSSWWTIMPSSAKGIADCWNARRG
jgi:glucose-6-phosphate-specific signal transduction histidine kinase